MQHKEQAWLLFTTGCSDHSHKCNRICEGKCFCTSRWGNTAVDPRNDKADNRPALIRDEATVRDCLLLLGGSGSGGSKPYVVGSARAGYQLLLEELNAQLIDIRPLKDARDAITPDLKEAKTKAAAVLYNGEDKNGFMKKLTLRFKDPENTYRYF